MTQRDTIEPTIEELRVLAAEAEIKEPETTVLGPLADRPEDQKAIDTEKKKTGIHSIVGQYLSHQALVMEAESKHFYELKDGYFQRVDAAMIRSHVEHILEYQCNNKMTAEFLGKIERRVAKPNAELVASTAGYINFRNGHYHKPTDTFEERIGELFHPERFFTYCLPFDYDPKAECPRFEQFLIEIASSADRPTGDHKMAQLILEYLGSTISGDKPLEHKALMLIGEGRNGKSVLLNLVQYMLGEGNCRTLGLADLGKPERRPGLERVLANVCAEESPKSFRDNAEALKAITASDTIPARVLGKQPYDIKPICKLWIGTNNQPENNDSSYGFASRLMPLPCDAAMVAGEEAKTLREKNQGSLPPGVFEIDPLIDDKLRAEAPGIFNLAWNAYAMAKRRGEFTKPESMKALHTEMRVEGALIQTIIRDCFEVVSGEFPNSFWPETVTCLKAFVAHSAQFGWRYAIDQKKFNKEVERTFGPAIKKQKTPDKMIFKGLRIKNSQSTNTPLLESDIPL